MLLASLIIGPLFTAGFAVMVKELVKAPTGYQDENGFHNVSARQGSAAARAKSKKLRRHAVAHSPFGGLQAAPAR